MTEITIIDAWRVKTHTGKLIKRYPLGLTIDDDRGVRYYATYDRVLSDPERDTVQQWLDQGSLF